MVPMTVNFPHLWRGNELLGQPRRPASREPWPGGIQKPRNSKTILDSDVKFRGIGSGFRGFRGGRRGRLLSSDAPRDPP
eukprot:182563-Amorphochlora_amoeboformis.AAC.1